MPLISKVAAQRRLPLRLQKATRRQRQALLKLPSPSPKPRRQRQRLAAPVVPATAEICQKANVPIKKYLLTGLLVWLPIAITIWVLLWVVGLADGILMGFLTALQTLSPDIVSGYLEQFKHIPGLGVLIVFTGLLLTGSLVSNVAGRWWLTQWDRLLTNIPVFKTIYNSVKKVQTHFSPAMATRFGPLCWCSTRDQVHGPSPFRPARPAVRWPGTWALILSACMCPPRPTRPAASF